MSAPEILCLGEPMVEFVREGGPESLAWRQGFGGDTSNAAISAARQGGKVGYLTALGEDRFGASLEALWAREDGYQRYREEIRSADRDLFCRS